MPNVLVRDVEESVLKKLKKLAEENGRSLQTEVQIVLRRHVENEPLSDLKVARKIKEGLRGRKHSDSAALLREDRSR
ncbi:MAG: TraY domain-containing protein [Acidobacteriota bacterium]|nr:TraY domain-containing protein [Acidobacteriota bacterium]